MTQRTCRLSSGLGAALLGALTLCAASARAAPGDATRLEYARSDRAARCPDQDALQGAVAKRLGYNPFFPAARQTIVVEITDAESGGLRAQMRLVDEQGIIRGSRELRDQVENCGELVASLALAISIALDPSAALGTDRAPINVAPSAPNPKENPQSAAEASPALAPKPAPAPTPPAPEKKRARPAQESPARADINGPSPLALRASAFSSLGVAPALAFGGRVGLSGQWQWFKLVGELSDQLPARRAVTGGSAEAALVSGTLAPCWIKRWLAGCALFEAGSLKTEGHAVQSPLVQRSLALFAGARAEATPVLSGHLRLLANLDLLRSLTPITLRLYGQDVWKTPFVSLAASLGVELGFP